MVGADAPVFGRLTSCRLHDSPCTLQASHFTTCIIEAEFGIRIGASVPGRGRPHDRRSIAAHVSTVMPSIEIVDHRFAGLDRLDLRSLAADNAIHGAWIRGPETRRWQQLDLASHPVSLRVDGTEVTSGAGDRVLGHPFEALAWLANAPRAAGPVARGRRLRDDRAGHR